MAINKIEYYGDVLLDLTGDTVTPDTLAEGEIAHDKSGNTIVGVMPPAIDTSDADAVADNILLNKTAYVDGEKIIGAMPNIGGVTQSLTGTTTSYAIPAGYHDGTGRVSHTTVNIPDPTITVSSAGLITASGNWTAGFTTDSSYSNTKQLTTKAAATITPNTTTQTAVNSGVYTTGVIRVNPIPSNYITTTDATATAADIIDQKTAYVNGSKVTGSLVVQKYYTGSSTPSSSLGANGDLYLKA